MSFAVPVSWVAVVALAAGGCGGDEALGGEGDTGAGETATGAASTGAGSSSSSSGSTSAGTSEASGDTPTTEAGGETGGETTGTGETGESGGESDESTSDTGAPAESRCEQTPELITCPKVTVELGPLQRDVHFQVPLGEPPPGGWPAVLMFQGSFFSAEVTWTATEGLPFGAYHQTRVVKELLDHGYAVVTPEAKLDGGTFWDTNVPPYSLAWETSDDHAFMLLVFAAIEDGTFGPLDAGKLFAAGVSSGGYMTSRMAVSYPGKFRSLAIAAGSYATCSGPLCSIPAQDPGHPPTLFLHGEDDLTVPLSTAVEYRDKLAAVGVDTRLVTDPDMGHGWIAASPEEVVTWFQGHP